MPPFLVKCRTRFYSKLLDLFIPDFELYILLLECPLEHGALESQVLIRWHLVRILSLLLQLLVLPAHVECPSFELFRTHSQQSPFFHESLVLSLVPIKCIEQSFDVVRLRAAWVLVLDEVRLRLLGGILERYDLLLQAEDCSFEEFDLLIFDVLLISKRKDSLCHGIRVFRD